ncbi:putative deoxyribonuclease tatdn2 [Borealophlyctis nickersoniae]|nr:putative deoxyribonuclease tatdn2 [Borealophlyctis nickersoniae]
MADSDKRKGRKNNKKGAQQQQPHPTPQTVASRADHPLTNEEYIDTHAHVHWTVERITAYKALPIHEAVAQFRHEYFPKNFAACVNVLCDPLSFTSLTDDWRKLVEASDFMYIACGMHPHYASMYTDETERDILAVMQHPRAVAFGEMGLDYNRMNSPREMQREVFIRQIVAALPLGKPIVIHTRDAEEDTLEIMEAHIPSHWKIHVHCYTGSEGFARTLLQKFENCFVGFTGVITNASAADLQAVVKDAVPLDRILLETDTPYMPPAGTGAKGGKGKFSHCGMIPYVAAKIAELKGLDLDVVMRATRENAKRMYGI